MLERGMCEDTWTGIGTLALGVVEKRTKTSDYYKQTVEGGKQKESA